MTLCEAIATKLSIQRNGEIYCPFNTCVFGNSNGRVHLPEGSHTICGSNGQVKKEQIEKNQKFLTYFLKGAHELAQGLNDMREILKIEDIMLYGSVARKKQYPKNLDILVIHNKTELENFDKIISDTNEDDLMLYDYLAKLLEGKVYIKQFFNGTKVEALIQRGKLNTRYIKLVYFNRNYRYMKKWDLRNRDPNFLNHVFREGLLWNPKIEKYNIPAKEKYSIPRGH